MTDLVENPTSEAPAPGGDAAPSVETPATTAPASDPATGTGGATSATAPVRPEGLPDEFWDATTGLKAGDLVSKFREVSTKLAEVEAAAGEIPKEAAGYAIAAPEDVQVPEGFTIQIDEKHPFLAEAREYALAQKWTQAQWKGVLALEAQRQIGFQKQLTEREVATRTALGENAEARLTDIHNRIKANLPADVANHVIATVSRYSDPAVIKGWEAIWALKSGPSVPANGGQNTSKFEGLHGSELLHALRSQKAA